MKKSLTILTIAILAIVAFASCVNAASVKVTPAQAKVGDTVTVTVHSDTPCYGVQFNMTYDSTRFEYAGNTAGAIVSASNGELICSYSNVAAPTNDVSLTFTVISEAPVGTGDFAISGTEFTDTKGDVTGEAVTEPTATVEIAAPSGEGNQPTDPTTPTEPTTPTTPVDKKGNPITEITNAGTPIFAGAIALIAISGAVLIIKNRK